MFKITNALYLTLNKFSESRKKTYLLSLYYFACTLNFVAIIVTLGSILQKCHQNPVFGLYRLLVTHWTVFENRFGASA